MMSWSVCSYWSVGDLTWPLICPLLQNPSSVVVLGVFTWILYTVLLLSPCCFLLCLMENSFLGLCFSSSSFKCFTRSRHSSTMSPPVPAPFNHLLATAAVSPRAITWATLADSTRTHFDQHESNWLEVKRQWTDLIHDSLKKLFILLIQDPLVRDGPETPWRVLLNLRLEGLSLKTLWTPNSLETFRSPHGGFFLKTFWVPKLGWRSTDGCCPPVFYSLASRI